MSPPAAMPGPAGAARATGTGCCVTCADEGVEMRVLAPGAGGLARCAAAAAADSGRRATEHEVDVSLLGPVGAGDRVLVHAGVALALLERTATAGGPG